MARPTGRYFASTIAKIRDAKLKENIVVDEKFKLHLRQQLMLKIDGVAKPAKISWASRFAPFKSYLTIVPAFAFVLLAVIGLSKLPVQITSNEVIPVQSPSQQNGAQSLNESMGALQQPQAFQQNSGTGIKTFPGRLALPPSFYNDTSAMSSAPALQSFLPQENSQPDQSSSIPSIQAPKPQAPAAPTQKAQATPPAAVPQNWSPFQNFTSQPQQNYGQQAPFQQNPSGIYGANVFGGASVNNQNSQPMPAPSSFGTTDNSVNNVTPTPAQTPVPVQPVPAQSVPVQIQTVVPNTVPSPTPAQTQADQTPQPVFVQPVNSNSNIAPTPAAISSQVPATPNQTGLQAPANTAVSNQINPPISVTQPFSESVLNIQQTPVTNALTAEPARYMNVKVFYNGSFATNEQTVLEKELIPQLVDGKNVDYVNVYQKDSGSLGIDVHFVDQHLETYNYTFNPAAGVFQLRIPDVMQMNQALINPSLSRKM